jgi:hypothetical protein
VDVKLRTEVASQCPPHVRIMLHDKGTRHRAVSLLAMLRLLAMAAGLRRDAERYTTRASCSGCSCSGCSCSGWCHRSCAGTRRPGGHVSSGWVPWIELGRHVVHKTLGFTLAALITHSGILRPRAAAPAKLSPRDVSFGTCPLGLSFGTCSCDLSLAPSPAAPRCVSGLAAPVLRPSSMSHVRAYVKYDVFKSSVGAPTTCSLL